MKQNEQKREEVEQVPSILAKRKLFAGDRVLWIIVTMLFAISIVVVYSGVAKVGFTDGGSPNNFLKKHIIILGLSAIIMAVCYLFKATWFRKLTWLAYIGSWVATLVPYFMTSTLNDAHRWINLGFIQFQPSELLKIATIMLLASRLSARSQSLGTLHLLPATFDVRKWGGDTHRNIILHEVLPVVLPIALTCMVILPAHTSSAIHIYFISMVLLFIAGIRFSEIAKLTLLAGVLGLAVIFTIGRGDTVVNRVKVFCGVAKADTTKLFMGKYSDSDLSRMAIQSGGVFGKGAGRSVMRARLMHPESDYIFAIVIEEFGLILSFVIVLLYLWLFFRSLRIFERCEWLYAGLLVVGLALLITSQGFLHIGVVIGAIPETGQNLPFITQGGTSMVCTAIAIGIILSISRQVDQGTILPPTKRNNNRLI